MGDESRVTQAIRRIKREVQPESISLREKLEETYRQQEEVARWMEFTIPGPTLSSSHFED
jgi:hypothetical protein